MTKSSEKDSPPPSQKARSTGTAAARWSPLRLVVFIAAALFVTEAAIMFVFNYLSRSLLSHTALIILDPIFQVALLTPVFYYFVFSPITSRDKKLQETELRYRTLFEQSPEGIMIIDVDTKKVVESNGAACAMLGYSQETLYQMTISDFEARDSAAEIAARVVLIEREGEVSFESAFRTDSGRLIDVFVSAKAVRLDDKKALNAIFRDITEAKRIAREDKLKAYLLDSVVDTIFALDGNGRFFYVNKVAYESRGYTKDELMAMNLRELDTPEAAKLIEQRMQGLIEKGSAVFESAHRRKDGTIMPVEIRARVIELDGNKVMLSVIQDITERKRAQAEVEKRLDELERFQRATINRELRIKELTDRVGELEGEIEAYKKTAN